MKCYSPTLYGMLYVMHFLNWWHFYFFLFDWLGFMWRPSCSIMFSSFFAGRIPMWFIYCEKMVPWHTKLNTRDHTPSLIQNFLRIVPFLQMALSRFANLIFFIPRTVSSSDLFLFRVCQTPRFYWIWFKILNGHYFIKLCYFPLGRWLSYFLALGLVCKAFWCDTSEAHVVYVGLTGHFPASASHQSLWVWIEYIDISAYSPISPMASGIHSKSANKVKQPRIDTKRNVF